MPKLFSCFWRGVLVCGALLLGVVGPVGAEDTQEAGQGTGDAGFGPRGKEVLWNPAWPEFRTEEWIATGLGVGLLAVSKLVPQRSVYWQGGIGFDEAARDALRLDTESARQWARDGSDIGITINESWPFIDALLVAGWYRRSPKVAWQQALITAEVLAITAGLQGFVSSVASRERPYVRDCGGELPSNVRDCTIPDQYWSFYSGHTSQSFAGATVLCMHHAYVPLYGGGLADALACVGALGVATTTALLRVGTDVHYVSDVMTGAVMGSAAGLLIPWALHYRHGAHSGTLGSEDWSLQVLPMGLGAQTRVVF